MSEQYNRIYGIIIILVGIGLILGSSLYIHDAYTTYEETQYEVENSIQTTGQITDNNIEEEQTTTEDGTETSYIFSVEYQYQVDGITYTSQSIAPAYDSETLSSKSSANEYKDKYSIGDEVTVNYLPSDHNESYLERSGTTGPILFIIVWLIFGIAGIYNIRIGARKYRAFSNTDSE